MGWALSLKRPDEVCFGDLGGPFDKRMNERVGNSRAVGFCG